MSQENARTVIEQAQTILTELLQNGYKPTNIGKAIGKSAQWVGHHRHATPSRPLDEETAQAILKVDWKTVHHRTTKANAKYTARLSPEERENKRKRLAENKRRSDQARRILHDLLKKGYSSADLAERLDTRPITIETCSRPEHWRGIPWDLLQKVLALDLDSLDPPTEVTYEPTEPF